MRGKRLAKIGAGMAALVLIAPSGAAARVPSGFVGMVADGPVFSRGVSLDGQLAKMEASGVQRVRVAFPWSQAQPYARWSQVPHNLLANFIHGPGGVPTVFYHTDVIVSQAARYHLSVLPVVTYAPVWDSVPIGNHRQPARYGPYARYMAALVNRYGPKGTFWRTHPSVPKRPITEWQIWNEPDLTLNWSTTPFARSYVALLRQAHRAIKHADPSAKIVLAALTNYGWRDLDSVYAIKGARGLFDILAANAYTAHPSGVITILSDYRRVMDQNHDSHKPIIATEIGWPSGIHKTTLNFGISSTERGQARKLSQLLPLLGRNRRSLRLAGFFYYTWLSTDPPHAGPFDYSGLLRLDEANNTIKAKPAYWAFRRAVARLEH